MSTKTSSRNRSPIFLAFGVEPRRFSHEESIAASVDERIGSVWHYLVRKANHFVETLSPRERSNFDVEDVLAELYIELRAKDDRWVPDRGRYITFAAGVASNCMSFIRDRSRTVETPRNGSWRLAKYQAAEDRGELSDKQAKTFADVRRTARACESIRLGGYQSTGDDWVEPATIDDSVESRERDRLTKDAIVWGILALTPIESMVIASWSGLRGKEPQTVAQIAEQLGKPIYEVKRARASAAAKIRERLLSMGHPAVASEN